MRFIDVLLLATLAYGQSNEGNCAAPAVSCTVLTFTTTGNYVWSPETAAPTITQTSTMQVTAFIPSNLPTITQCAACSGTTVYAWQNSFHGMPWPKAIPGWIIESIGVSININIGSYPYGAGPQTNNGFAWQNSSAPSNMTNLPSWVYNPAAADQCDYGYYLPSPVGTGWIYPTNAPPTTASTTTGVGISTTQNGTSYSYINDPYGNSIVPTGIIASTSTSVAVTTSSVTAAPTTLVSTTASSFSFQPEGVPPPPSFVSSSTTTSAASSTSSVAISFSDTTTFFGVVVPAGVSTSSSTSTFSSFSVSTSAPACTPVASQYAPGQSCNCNYAIESCSEIIPRSTETAFTVPAGQATTLDQCIAVCDNELDCVSLSFQISTETCILYDDSNTYTDPNSTILNNPDYYMANVISTQCPNSDCSLHDF